MTEVIKRTDYEAFSDNVYQIVCFCKKCDPKGIGGHGGMLGSIGHSGTNKELKATLSKFSRFCPTCGEVVDWDVITEIANCYNK